MITRSVDGVYGADIQIETCRDMRASNFPATESSGAYLGCSS